MEVHLPRYEYRPDSVLGRLDRHIKAPPPAQLHLLYDTIPIDDMRELHTLLGYLSVVPTRSDHLLVVACLFWRYKDQKGRLYLVGGPGIGRTQTKEMRRFAFATLKQHGRLPEDADFTDWNLIFQHELTLEMHTTLFSYEVDTKTGRIIETGADLDWPVFCCYYGAVPICQADAEALGDDYTVARVHIVDSPHAKVDTMYVRDVHGLTMRGLATEAIFMRQIVQLSQQEPKPGAIHIVTFCLTLAKEAPAGFIGDHELVMTFEHPDKHRPPPASRRPSLPRQAKRKR